MAELASLEVKNSKVYCIICCNVHILSQLAFSKSKEDAFITAGFDNWKDVTQSLNSIVKVHATGKHS